MYLVLKALHIIFVTAWFAGLFYLPRIFVNLAMTPENSQAEAERLLLMARKLYRFMTPLCILAIILGVALWIQLQPDGGWLHLKTLLVIFLVAYHFYCGRLLRQFQARQNARPHVWFRFFNEIPALALFAVVFLVVLKPF
jgi:putative membrane protein